MNIMFITDEYSVSPQISAVDVATLVTQGFKSVICNRPDSEEGGQPPFADVEQACKDAGIEFRYLPITHAGMSPESLAEISTAFATMQKPILGYCRSGARSNMAWQARTV